MRFLLQPAQGLRLLLLLLLFCFCFQAAVFG
jgi:hypothetical protein